MANEILNLTGTDGIFMFQLKQAQELFSNADSYKKFYAAQLSEIDLEQEDVLHYMELREKMSGAELLKAACALRKIRHKRRDIKNKVALANIFAACTAPKDKTIVDLLKDPMGEGKTKKYHVKTNILKEVFGYEGKTIKTN